MRSTNRNAEKSVVGSEHYSFGLLLAYAFTVYWRRISCCVVFSSTRHTSNRFERLYTVNRNVVLCSYSRFWLFLVSHQSSVRLALTSVLVHYLCIHFLNPQILEEYNNYVSVVTLTKDIASIRLDGAQLTSGFAQQNIGQYTTASGRVAHGSHWLSVTAGSTATFAAYAYGHSTGGFSSYGYPTTYAGRLYIVDSEKSLVSEREMPYDFE